MPPRGIDEVVFVFHEDEAIPRIATVQPPGQFLKTPRRSLLENSNARVAATKARFWTSSGQGARLSREGPSRATTNRPTDPLPSAKTGNKIIINARVPWTRALGRSAGWTKGGPTLDQPPGGPFPSHVSRDDESLNRYTRPHGPTRTHTHPPLSYPSNSVGHTNPTRPR